MVRRHPQGQGSRCEERDSLGDFRNKEIGGKGFWGLAVLRKDLHMTDIESFLRAAVHLAPKKRRLERP